MIARDSIFDHMLHVSPGIETVVKTNASNSRRYIVQRQRKKSLHVPTNAGRNNYEETRLKLLSIVNSQGDYGAAIPFTSKYEALFALDILKELYDKMGDLFPKPHISPDRQGGIRIEWMTRNESVKVICGADIDSLTYLYHRIRDESTIDEKIYPPSLGASRLKHILTKLYYN